MPDGSIKHLHDLAHRSMDEAGNEEVVGAIMDVTERKKADEERDRVRRLEAERETAVANERSRLAGEIHDTLAQGLAMIVMQLADAEAKLGPAWSRAEKPLSMVRELAVESLAYARRSVSVLRPNVATGGLARSIRDIADSVRRHFEGPLILDVAGDAVLLDAAVESALAGIAREAVDHQQPGDREHHHRAELRTWCRAACCVRRRNWLRRQRGARRCVRVGKHAGACGESTRGPDFCH